MVNVSSDISEGDSCKDDRPYLCRWRYCSNRLIINRLDNHLCATRIWLAKIICALQFFDIYFI